MRKPTLQEMQGMLRGQCIPGNMKVNESLAAYLLRAMDEYVDQQVQELFERCKTNDQICQTGWNHGILPAMQVWDQMKKEKQDNG